MAFFVATTRHDQFWTVIALRAGEFWTRRVDA
jgi:hypothetical protein